MTVESHKVVLMRGLACIADFLTTRGRSSDSLADDRLALDRSCSCAISGRHAIGGWNRLISTFRSCGSRGLASGFLLLFLVQYAEMVGLPIQCRRRNTGSFLIA